MFGSSLDSAVQGPALRLPIVVLLVDDQAFVGNALGLMLRSEHDIDLHHCRSAVNAVALANQLDPTLILQDRQMPEIDGLTLIRSFRANSYTAGTPVIMLSGDDDAETRARALAEGATGYLVKLPPKMELIASIRQHASRSAGGRNTLDLAVVDRFRAAGAPAFAGALIDRFIAEAGARVRGISAAADSRDAAALRGIATSLRRSSSTMGAVRLAALCMQVEDQVAASPTGEIARALTAEIEREWTCVQRALTIQRERFGQK